jgi:putative colanic acid biosynthesis UDP-glucose lipid carrier transferase
MSERAGQIVVVVFGRELVIGRVTSLVVAAIMLVELLPLLCLIALAIKVESSKSPLLFVQDRLDRRGRRFRLMKFRTMDNCQRITSVGRVLRRTSLDELPQFWGVILGGYRPKTDLQS